MDHKPIDIFGDIIIIEIDEIPKKPELETSIMDAQMLINVSTKNIWYEYRHKTNIYEDVLKFNLQLFELKNQHDLMEKRLKELENKLSVVAINE